MQQVFLSFTYNPHPDHVEVTEKLRRYVSVVIETMELKVVTGEDLGGEQLTDEIKRRIEASDALVALVTPWKDQLGNKVPPPWVQDEFTYAKAMDKPAIRLLHTDFAAAGMYAAHEYMQVKPDNPTDALIKLMRTLRLWKDGVGRPMDIEITPIEADAHFDTAQVKSCEFQLFMNYKEGPWRPATVWPQPGGMYAHLPGVPAQAKLRLRLRVGNETWESPFNSPVGRIALSRSVNP
jgi:hypothetical protein